MSKNSDSGALLLQPKGRLDADTCIDLRTQLGAAFAAGVRAVVIDLRDVPTVDPVGLGVLTGASRHLRRKGGVLVVTHPVPAVVKTLRINGMTDLLEIPLPPPVRGLRAANPATSSGRSARRSGPRPLTAVAEEHDAGELALPG